MSALPIIIAVLVGIIVYVLGVMALPKSVAPDTTSFTRKQLKHLEYIEEGAAGTQEDSLMRDRYQSTGLLSQIYYAMPLGSLSHQYLVRGGMAASVDKLFLFCLGVFMPHNSKQDLSIWLVFLLSFTAPALADSEKHIVREEKYINPRDIVYAEIICEPEKNLYKIYPYQFAGGRSKNEEERRKDLIRETEANPKLKEFSKHNTGIFVNGKLIHKKIFEHICSLPSGVAVKTTIDFGKPFVTKIEGVSTATTGLRYTQIDSPIEVKITENEKILAKILDVFQAYVLQFSKDTLGICHGRYEYMNEYDTRCKQRTTTELRSEPLLATGYIVDIIN